METIPIVLIMIMVTYTLGNMAMTAVPREKPSVPRM